MKTEKISKMALYICIGIILVCFVLFMTIGYDNPVGDYNEPKLTNLIMWLMYAMGLVTVIITIWSVIHGIQSNKGAAANATSGVPGGKISFFTMLLMIASLAIGAITGIGEPDFTAADGTVTTGTWVTVVDAFCISIAIMFIAAIIVVAISMTGILTKSASK